MNKFDCLLLQHMLWQRPDEAQRILDFLLERLAIESSTQQTDYLFDGVLCLHNLASHLVLVYLHPLLALCLLQDSLVLCNGAHLLIWPC